MFWTNTCQIEALELKKKREKKKDWAESGLGEVAVENPSEEIPFLFKLKPAKVEIII